MSCKPKKIRSTAAEIVALDPELFSRHKLAKGQRPLIEVLSDEDGVAYSALRADPQKHGGPWVCLERAQRGRGPRDFDGIVFRAMIAAVIIGCDIVVDMRRPCVAHTGRSCSCGRCVGEPRPDYERR